MGLLDWINPLKPLTDAALQAQQNWLTARNDSERLKAEQEQAFWHDRIAAVSASQADRPWSPRSLMGYAAALYVLKIVVWDTVLQWGVTPDPGDQVTWVVVTIVGFYFVSRSAETIVGTIAARLSRK